MASAPSKTVVVLGASYGGARAAQVIAAGLPEGWRLVLIDRNSCVYFFFILKCRFTYDEWILDFETPQSRVHPPPARGPPWA
ncbi:hypothetical protein B0H13DRAFT_754356 [Mycena leptocephala]|nr:hypothetical protein B0H13DRAFT_754356 [Mycena leptocephala]